MLLRMALRIVAINCAIEWWSCSIQQSCVRGNTSLEDYSTVGSASICQPSQSAINDLFQAHYRSSLTCLKCGHRSHTFDPFLTISLSILSSSSLSLGLKHPIYVVVVYLSATPKQVIFDVLSFYLLNIIHGLLIMQNFILLIWSLIAF